MKSLLHLPFRLREQLRDLRTSEYEAADRFLAGCGSILDVGSGTGTFLARDPSKRVGVDLNPENVAHCQERGLSAVVGSALDLPFENSSFDAVISSHVFQVFSPEQAMKAVNEMARVVKPNGVLIITTLNHYKYFFEHPENARPYPPAAIRRYTRVQHNETSPMWPGMPRLVQEGIWLRREPLIFLSPTPQGNPRTEMVRNLINGLQYGLRIVNPFKFDAYVMKLRCFK